MFRLPKPEMKQITISKLVLEYPERPYADTKLVI